MIGRTRAAALTVLVPVILILATSAHSGRAQASDAAAYLDVALRQLDSVERFDDFAQVAANQFADDIRDAFEFGLIVGKYDESRQYFDPDAAITTGEMVNILARNLGATPTTQGREAADYLASLGVTVAASLDGALGVATLESLAQQIVALDQAGKADLLVVRQALEGTVSADPGGTITRAHAVAMYRPPTVPAPGDKTAVLPQPPDASPPQANWWPYDERYEDYRDDPGPVTRPRGTAGPRPLQTLSPPPARLELLFVLTD